MSNSGSNVGQPLLHATLSWDFTKGCDLTCSHCSNADDRAVAGADLKLDVAAHLLAEFSDAGGSSLHLLGGEPLLRRDALTTIAVARELGLRVSLTTNGQRRPDIATADWLVQHLTVLSVSLDGHTAEINDPIRGRGSFQAASASLSAYRAARDAVGHGTILNVSHVLCAANIAHLNDMVACADRLGADELSVTYLKPWGSAAKSGAPHAASPETVLAAFDLAAQAAQAYAIRVTLFEVPARVQARLRDRWGDRLGFGGDTYCDTAEGQLRASSDGKVYPCFAGTKRLRTPEPDALDTRRAPLRQILDGSAFATFRAEAHEALAATPWAICRGCTHFHDRTCYPGCPFEPENLKPQLCECMGSLA